MNKESTDIQLSEKHHSFIGYIQGLEAAEFTFSKNDKWTPGQQLEHILLAVKPVRLACSLPKFLLNMVWGKANRPSKSYDELVKKYTLKLADGGRATGRFVPKKVPIEKKKALIENLQHEVVRLQQKLNRFSEAELDLYILPHPLLGKLTLREMLYFTIYHVEHHQQLTKRDLNS
jgi:DinB superfamily